MRSETFIPAAGFHWLTPYYEPIFGPFAGRIWRAVAAEAARCSPCGGHVVDLGCGPGTVLRLLHRLRPDLALTGIDIDPRILAIARKRAATTISFHQASAGGTGLPDQFADVLLSSFTFHHLSADTKRATLAEARRILKSGGTFILCDFSRPRGRVPRLLGQLLGAFEPEVTPQLAGQLYDLATESEATIETRRTFAGLISLHLVNFAERA